YFATTDPAYGDTVWRGGAASADQVRDAVAAARRAFREWARTPGEQREAIARAYAGAIKKREASLAQGMEREMGKPLWEAKTEIAAFMGKVDISIRTRNERAGEREDAAAFGATALAHRPHGVLAVFGPYNFPAHLPNGHIVPALLAGNAV